MVEGAGFILVVLLLGANWLQARREKDLPGGPPWARDLSNG